MSKPSTTVLGFLAMGGLRITRRSHDDDTDDEESSDEFLAMKSQMKSGRAMKRAMSELSLDGRTLNVRVFQSVIAEFRGHSHLKSIYHHVQLILLNMDINVLADYTPMVTDMYR
jgi:hypothetical protein